MKGFQVQPSVTVKRRVQLFQKMCRDVVREVRRVLELTLEVQKDMTVCRRGWTPKSQFDSSGKQQRKVQNMLVHIERGGPDVLGAQE